MNRYIIYFIASIILTAFFAAFLPFQLAALCTLVTGTLIEIVKTWVSSQSFDAFACCVDAFGAVIGMGISSLCY